MLIIGHRGAMGLSPENTLASFELAILQGCDMIEFDVHRCASGELVVIHDERVDRTTNGTGLVEAMTYSELASLDAGGGGRIPLLTEVLECAAGRVAVNVELKAPSIAGDAAYMLSHYIDAGVLKSDSVIVSSFWHRDLAEFRSLCPGIRTGALIAGEPVNLASFAEGAWSVHQDIGCLSRDFVDDAHARNLSVLVYTVNEPDDVLRMRSWGVDGIFTNFPLRSRRVWEEAIGLHDGEE